MWLNYRYKSMRMEIWRCAIFVFHLVFFVFSLLQGEETNCGEFYLCYGVR